MDPLDAKMAQIRAAIIAEAAHETGLFSERDFSRRFNLTRYVTKKVLTVLESDGLIRCLPQRGYQVVDYTHTDNKAMEKMRCVLEGDIARSAARNATREDIVRLSLIVEDMGEMARQGDTDKYRLLDYEFHRGIALASQDPMFLKMFDSLQSMRFVFRSPIRGFLLHLSQDDHVAIFEAIKSGNADAAEEAMYVHLGRSLIQAAQLVNTMADRYARRNELEASLILGESSDDEGAGEESAEPESSDDRQPAARKDKGGFTLVELLVVIGIIALLISILLPSLNRARMAAQDVQCLSQLRQIALASRMYTDNFQGYYPTMRGVPDAHRNAWYTNLTPFISPGSGQIDVMTKTIQEVRDYNAIWEKLRCPAEGGYLSFSGTTDRFGTLRPDLQGVHRTYGIHMAILIGTTSYNWTDGFGIVNYNTGQTRKITEVRRAAETAVFFDTRDIEYHYPNMWPRLLALEPESTIYLDAARRHNGKYMVAFADGHATPMPQAEFRDQDNPIWRVK